MNKAVSRTLRKYINEDKNIKDVFYIQEFMDMIDEVNTNNIFGKMINWNGYNNLGIHKFTKKSIKIKTDPEDIRNESTLYCNCIFRS